jgi:hypothetical protein
MVNFLYFLNYLNHLFSRFLYVQYEIPSVCTIYILYMHSILPGIWRLRRIGFPSYTNLLVGWEKLLQKPDTKSKQHICSLVLVLEFSRWLQIWSERLRYIYLNTNWSSLYFMPPVWQSMTDSVADGDLENYHVTGKHMYIKNLFLNNRIKM